ncbi:hypothetical protein [Zoogloea sp.]|uniref:hypothetical protein n=1 Tax=Zoogloea sp. TaxID=49181 RepID=UPI001AD1799B|nr:hypothetical protein [Zoogloea sp.]MBN8285467.1 hypothetical protein [Zoogloea sp.]
MSQQQIIRNVTTLDRHPAPRRSTAEIVCQSVMAQGGEFTTRDIAEAVGVDEYSVRAALSWLLKRKIVAPAGEASRPYPASAGQRLQGKSYTVTLYRVVERGQAPDFAALMGAFCRG